MEDYDILEPQDINDSSLFRSSLNYIRNLCNPRTYEWQLFPKEIASNQLKQAGGTCYFVSAIESLSHIPNILEYLFPNAKNFSAFNESFEVQFYGMSGKTEPKIYLIRNKFPVEKNELKFMKPLENEAYAIILEKAWAAIVGGYKNIDGGRAYNVLNNLLGTSCKCVYNEKMEILTTKFKDKEKKEIEFINKKNSNDKNDPEFIFEEIKQSFKNDCPIITTSINMEDGGHEYSILGTYSEIDPFDSYNIQEFIILKNPWRSGSLDLEKEKINEYKINKIIDKFQDIKAINDLYKDTGVFYMPKEYFIKWFRDVTICRPNYKKFFPKVYNNKKLYDAINKFYGYNSNQNFFDISQGNRLIKVNIISKKNFEDTNKKIIQNNASEFAYVYDTNLLSSIWRIKNKVGITPDYCFARKKNGDKYELNKNPEMLNFNNYEIYVPNIAMINKKDKCFCVTELKRINTLEEFKSNKEKNKKYLENKDTKDIDLFKSDFEQLNELNDEIQKYLKEIKYSKKHIVRNSKIGWVNTFKGINLCSNENYKLSDNKSPETHYCLHNLSNFNPSNENDLLNLFDYIGKQYKCSCYYIKDGKRIKYCNQYFKFEKLIYIYRYQIKIDKVSINKFDNHAYFFTLSEKIESKGKKSKKFFIHNK